MAEFTADDLIANLEAHAAHHKMLHQSLDRLNARFFEDTKKFFDEATVMDLVQWSGEHLHDEESKRLHNHLDELAADWLCQTGNLLSHSTLDSFAKWSFGQTTSPTGLFRA